ncbi:2-hydroxyacid dehydrogenase [Alcaligenes aquatilis]|uniref:2-hydroxyacid dehydrogenase n=1 Tax=Alcaligenes TaxID=507 RepID=UPI001E5B634B|nr:MULTISPECIES: 2-hydroxyacid dehydrogenase [unclassified Alcaligenes]MCC9163091.1 2-hydroxyacid dehydrogenase [Alcaligenes sp. MMA]UYY88646.1 2-hydroxyacid dehydrogenase [Alcaligenes sp. SMD-FA]
MTRPIVLQLASLAQHPSFDDIDRYFERIVLPDLNQLCAEQIERVQVLLTSAVTPTPASLIDRLPALKAICSVGVGYDCIDVHAAQQRGIQVSTTPDVLNDCVADMAWALMLDAARRVTESDRYVRAGLWDSPNGFGLGTRVSGKKLGIVGLGRIGQTIARRASGFDMELRYHNRRPRRDVPWHYEPSLIELAHWADFMVIAAVGGDETRGLINIDVLNALGPKGILVNIARGSVVDESALIAALQEGRLGAAGLDVFENEPQVPQALRDLKQVVLAPHTASATHETRQAMLSLALDNILQYQKTGKVLTLLAV